MLPVLHNYPLHKLNTFGMKVYAAHYSILTDESSLRGLATQPAYQSGFMMLGGGSNVLFTGDQPQWIIHNLIKGIQLVREDDDFVWVRAGAGEVWHDFVLHCMQHDYAGVENLSLIPGTVGAAPIQNIGAYGAEAREVIASVRCWHPDTEHFSEISNEDCVFGYRDSIFKREWKGKTIITSVLFRLAKKPDFKISYGNIQQELEAMGVQDLSIQKISEAVIRIRTAKLPNPKEIGNAGSFFKNPEITNHFYQQLAKDFPGIPGYPVANSQTKIPAGWLIEQCGWKGFREADFGVHKNQALVLVNYGNAQGMDIAELALKIMDTVEEKFGVLLEKEVQIC